jgi:hypothetical protein
MAWDYKGFYGEWNFDYDWAAFMDPDYAQYLSTSVEVVEADYNDTPLCRLLRNHSISEDRLIDDDNDVLQLMHTEDQPPRKEIAPMALHERHVVELSDSDKYTERYNYLQKRSNYQRKFYPGPLHSQARKTIPPMPSVPLLAPPNASLANKSKVLSGDLHTITQISDHLELADHAILEKAHVEEDDTFIRMWVYNRTLNRVYKSSTRRLQGCGSLVFNKRTNNIYYIHYAKKAGGKKGAKRVRKITSFSTQLSLLEYSFITDKPVISKFTDKLAAHAKRIVERPDELVRMDKPAEDIITLLWQIKVRQSLPWITNELLNGVRRVREYFPMQHRDYDVVITHKPKGRFFAMLRRTPSPKTVFKHLLGSYYSPIIYKTCRYYSNPSDCSPFEISKVITKDKHAYNVFANILNIKLGFKRANFIETYQHSIICKSTDDPSVLWTKYLHVVNKMANDKNCLTCPTWITFRDIHTMADKLHISLNRRRLNNTTTINELHTRLTAIDRRDRQLKREVNPLLKNFVPFAHPKREYDGFVFEHLTTSAALLKEGTEMKHCVASYAGYCAEGRSVIFSMRKDNVGFATIELRGTNKDYEIVQQYTRHDVTITNPAMLKIIDRWHRDVVKMHEEDSITYYDFVDAIKHAILEKQEIIDTWLERAEFTQEQIDFIHKLKQEYEQIKTESPNYILDVPNG